MTSALTLLDLNMLVKNRLRRDFPDTFWVQAEVSDCKEHYSGHCYLELVQKKEGSDALCAKARATIWANVWSSIKPKFFGQTGFSLQAGQKILAEVAVEFHELYGFSLLIRDIDPTYTLGDVTLRRQEVLRKLTEEGVIDLNKELEWPTLPKRIAVVSSPSAAGYEDFMDQLRNNAYGFSFFTRFFPAFMQGEGAGQSICNALDTVVESGVEFDAAVIIRGGGATTDLQCFDQYELCFYAAQYPIPLLTGIGHDRDSSVLDRVAHTSVKTPTAAAEYLIDCLAGQAFRLDECTDKLMQRTQNRLEGYKFALQQRSERLRRITSEGLRKAAFSVERAHSEVYRSAKQVVMVRNQELVLQHNSLRHRTQQTLLAQQHRLELMHNKLETHSPDIMLQRGFSLTLQQGRVVTSINELKPGTEIITRLRNGIVQSVVSQTLPSND